MKMSAEDVQGLLSKAIESALSDDTISKKDNTVDLQKEIRTIGAQVQALAKAAANGFEKPKTTEEIVQDSLGPITKAIEELKKGITNEDKKDDVDPDAPVTKSDLAKAVGEALKDALKGLNKSSAPKGKGKRENVEDMSDETAADLIKSLVDGDDGEDNTSPKKLSKETEDPAGNPLSKQQREDRSDLDDFFAKALVASEKAFADSDDDDDDDDD